MVHLLSSTRYTLAVLARLMALHQMAALLVRASADEAPVQVDDADIVDLDRVASESG